MRKKTVEVKENSDILIQDRLKKCCVWQKNVLRMEINVMPNIIFCKVDIGNIGFPVKMDSFSLTRGI